MIEIKNVYKKDVPSLLQGHIPELYPKLKSFTPSSVG